jgi:hypothetical protein
MSVAFLSAQRSKDPNKQVGSRRGQAVSRRCSGNKKGQQMMCDIPQSHQQQQQQQQRHCHPPPHPSNQRSAPSSSPPTTSSSQSATTASPAAAPTSGCRGPRRAAAATCWTPSTLTSCTLRPTRCSTRTRPRWRARWVGCGWLVCALFAALPHVKQRPIAPLARMWRKLSPDSLFLIHSFAASHFGPNPPARLRHHVPLQRVRQVADPGRRAGGGVPRGAEGWLIDAIVPAAMTPLQLQLQSSFICPLCHSHPPRTRTHLLSCTSTVQGRVRQAPPRAHGPPQRRQLGAEPRQQRRAAARRRDVGNV